MLTDKQINEKLGLIRLQGIGYLSAIRAEELQVGDITVWNYGFKEEVIEIEPTKSGKSFNLIIKSLDNGKTYKRRLRNNRLVAVRR